MSKEIEFVKSTFGFDGDFEFAFSLTEANIMVAANIGINLLKVVDKY